MSIAPAQPQPARRRLLIVIAVLAVVVLAVDLATKWWAEDALAGGARIPLLGDLLGFMLIHNAGAALSIATGMTWVLTFVATAVVVVVIRASRRIGSRGWALALGLILGGALGNLADRFFREPGFARGHVVDFIAYGNLFVGNVADIAIVGAAGLIIVLALRGIRIDGTRERADRGVVEPGARRPAATETEPTETEPNESEPTESEPNERRSPRG